MKHELNFENEWVDQSYKKISITALIETLKVPFDAESKAAELSVKQYNTPGAKYVPTATAAMKIGVHFASHAETA